MRQESCNSAAWLGARGGVGPRVCSRRSAELGWACPAGLFFGACVVPSLLPHCSHQSVRVATSTSSPYLTSHTHVISYRTRARPLPLGHHLTDSRLQSASEGTRVRREKSGATTTSSHARASAFPRTTHIVTVKRALRSDDDNNHVLDPKVDRGENDGSSPSRYGDRDPQM